MSRGRNAGAAILVVEDVEETRDCIQRLLETSGFRVMVARDEIEAALKARMLPTDLILISIGLDAARTIAVAKRIREHSARTHQTRSQQIPIVLFCVGEPGDHSPTQIESNIYTIQPDNFDELRRFLKLLL
jgi:CheY-like chemotaxis protein